jgi:5-methylcytosine-specific restriction enzyme A
MATKRSPEMVLAGFYLAKFGRQSDKGTLPPGRLGTDHWNSAYLVFYAALGDGRTPSTFHLSLRNARDLFDGHVASGRIGWRQDGPQRIPLALTREAARIFGRWNNASEAEVWEAIAPFADLGAGSIPRSVVRDLEAEIDPASRGLKARTEGGEKLVVSMRKERDPRLRAEALAFHGYTCAVCGFDFGAVYGKWGEGFAEVHHREPLGGGALGERETDPRTDLIVLCANCHRMTHRTKGKCLTVEELRARIDWDALARWATRPR